MKFIIFFLTICLCFNVNPKHKLSEYNIYKGDPKKLIPQDEFIPYSLITPLFTDYAHKHRMIYIPKGKKIKYNDKNVFELPVGSIIVKTFYYPFDFDNINKGIDLVETRILIHDINGWQGFPYVWNEKDNEAILSVAGGQEEVSWESDNKKYLINYFIPNLNQCKGCHINDNIFLPIGPSARQLNTDYLYPNGQIKNQLVEWYEQGILDFLPEIAIIDKIADWDDPKSGDLNDRARAWLDINCAHCHNKNGPAKTSGLFLDIYEENSKSLGLYKKPIAAGRGSGNLEYDIFPGYPEKSILIYRFDSTDPGIMMPELGRTLVHKEGLELIKEWIISLK